MTLKSRAIRNDRQAAAFDQFAANYDEALQRGLAVSGESRDYFAEQRVLWLRKRLLALEIATRSILDYGCGTGGNVSFLSSILSPDSIVGLDVSSESLEVAGRRYVEESISFSEVATYQPDASIDLCFTNGVFHHIPPDLRLATARYIADTLVPGGVFAFWENNPWNPGTRIVMSRIPFDRDAQTMTSRTARVLLATAGFRVLRVDHLFVFPRPLKWLRKLEPGLAGLPIGAQYLVLAQKPRER